MKKFAKVMAVALVAVMVLAVLVACGPASDPDKAVKALKDNGYASAVKVSASGYSYKGLTAVVTASKGLVGALLGNDDFQTITIYYFEDTASANDAWEKIKSDSDKDKEKNKDSDWVCKKSGKVIYYGTKQAVKDAR